MLKLDLSQLRIDFHTTPVPGVDSLVASHPATPVPVGYLWFQYVMKNQIVIIHCWTYEPCRRQGVCTALLRYLRKGEPTFLIGTATANEMSAPLLTKLGFAQCNRGWVWLHPEPSPSI